MAGRTHVASANIKPFVILEVSIHGQVGDTYQVL